MKKKVSKRGGYRPGAGAKKTGRNTTCISFSVHKDFAEPLKELVYAKIIELKAARDGTPLPKDFVPFQHKMAFIKKVAAEGNGKKTQTCMEAAKRIAASPSFKKIAAERAAAKAPVSEYLKSRRSKKLGLK